MEGEKKIDVELLRKVQSEQLEKLDRLFQILDSNQSNPSSNVQKRHRRSQSAFTLPIDQYESKDECVRTTDDTVEKVAEKIEALTEKAEHCTKMLNAELQQEKNLRVELQNKLNQIEYMLDQDRSKRINKLRNYASLADDEGDILLSSLMKKAEKNDADFSELKNQFENRFNEQTKLIKQLIKERELLHLHIKRLEKENGQLAAVTKENETIRLLTLAAQIPTDLDESFALVQKLRDEIIQQVKIREKVSNDFEQCRLNHDIDIRERQQIEELLTRDLTAKKEEILLLQTVKSEYDRILPINVALEKQIQEVQEEIERLKLEMLNETLRLKQEIEALQQEKEELTLSNATLRAQNQQLKVDFENMESVQHDFVRLSQTLQMQLEEIRENQNELRWQPEEDFTHCQKCRIPFSVTWRKHHCRHCGKVLCKNCTSKTIFTGPNERPSRVCELCFMLLNKNSLPESVSLNGKVPQ